MVVVAGEEVGNAPYGPEAAGGVETQRRGCFARADAQRAVAAEGIAPHDVGDHPPAAALPLAGGFDGQILQFAAAAVCADETASWKRKGDGHDHADVDAAIAAEHICLAAAEQGLGSCWVCNFDVPLCREALRLPAELRPVALIPVGYAADEAATKKRKPMEEIVAWR